MRVFLLVLFISNNQTLNAKIYFKPFIDDHVQSRCTTHNKTQVFSLPKSWSAWWWGSKLRLYWKRLSRKRTHLLSLQKWPLRSPCLAPEVLSEQTETTQIKRNDLVLKFPKGTWTTLTLEKFFLIWSKTSSLTISIKSAISWRAHYWEVQETKDWAFKSGNFRMIKDRNKNEVQLNNRISDKKRLKRSEFIRKRLQVDRRICISEKQQQYREWIECKWYLLSCESW